MHLHLPVARSAGWTQPLARACEKLRGVADEPRREAELLLAHAVGATRAQVMAQMLDAPDAESIRRFENLVARRADGEPLAYLSGRREFWSLPLAVTPDVLVPRPETELLVTWALELLAATPSPRVADLGTGSGAIAAAIASERADAQICATDLSPAALAVAHGNAQRLGLRHIRFVQGRWLAPLAGETFDLIVANPPYVAGGDPHLHALRFEPALALVGGGDGLDPIRAIAAAAPAHLRAGGWLLLEHGADQAAAVRALLAGAGLQAAATRRDLAGLERASGARR